MVTNNNFTLNVLDQLSSIHIYHLLVRDPTENAILLFRVAIKIIQSLIGVSTREMYSTFEYRKMCPKFPFNSHNRVNCS